MAQATLKQKPHHLNKMNDESTKRYSEDAFQQLKELLLNEDQSRIKELESEIAALKQQLAEKDRLIGMIEPVVVDVLKKRISESRKEMAIAIAPIMSESIKAQIANAKDDMVDALYPLLGAMVRKSITEAMKRLVEQVNEAMSNAFSWRMMKARLFGKVTGKSPGEIVLADAAPFELEGIYLIAKGSGLLIAYNLPYKPQQESNQSQVIGGMLTAIKSFVETAFAEGQADDLQEINLDEHKIRIQSGRYTYLAVVYTGVPDPDEFDEALRNCHEDIHKHYHQYLRDYDGDATRLVGIEKPINELIRKLQKR